MQRFHRLVATLVLFVAPAAAGGEGMWLPRQLPQLAAELQRAGIASPPAALADLGGQPLAAIVSTGGCSASFVSPDGLVVTNHHCVNSYLQYNSTPERDLLDQGFLARTRGEELPASPGARLYVLQSLRDVTREMVGDLSPQLADRERFHELDRREKALIAACEAPGGVRCKVAKLFDGLEYQLQTQLELRDVRLVYAPPRAIGNFGGEVDNWIWPRHTGDFGFLRGYVGADGKPADPATSNVPYRPAHWLQLASDDLDPGAAVLVAGYPGVTFRLQTAGEVRESIEHSLPDSIRNREALIAALEERGKGDRAVALKNAARLRSLYNLLKKYQGTLAAFQRAGVLAQREREERALGEKLGPVVAALDAQHARLRATRQRDTTLRWLMNASPLLNEAERVHKLSIERAKPDAERLADYQQRNWPLLEGASRRAQSSIEPGSDRAGLRLFLIAATELPSDQRITGLDRLLAATGEKTPAAQVDALLTRLYAGTKLADLETRLQMLHESSAELLARADPMVELAAALRPQLDEVEERKQEIDGALSRLRPPYVAAVIEARGGRLAPDANGTLRVSFGKVTGYAPRDGMAYQAQTTVEGLLEKESGAKPFDNPPALLQAVKARDFGPYADPDLGTLPVAFVSTADITNGSSGSATLDAQGRLCGLAFDGNIEAMSSDYLVEPELTRSIHVDSRYMLWVMDRVDGAHALLREMGIQPAFPATTAPAAGR